MKKVLIAGGTGFIGSFLENHLQKQHYQVYILSRNPKRENEILWDAKSLNSSWAKHLENLDVLINLTGKNINCRFTKKNKHEILNSRIQATNVLGEAINKCKIPPKLWMNASTTSIYKESFTEKMTEIKNEIGNDFEAEVAKQWEKTFNQSNTPKTRKIILRTAVVLGNASGAFVPLKKLAQFGLGGKQGTGKQLLSWIHAQDYAKAVQFLMENPNTKGPFNLCAPNPISNSNFMKTIRNKINMPFGIPSPEFILKIGAFFIQTEPELILKSRNVYPEKLLAHHFTFTYHTAEKAIKNLLYE